MAAFRPSDVPVLRDALRGVHAAVTRDRLALIAERGGDDDETAAVMLEESFALANARTAANSDGQRGDDDFLNATELRTRARFPRDSHSNSLSLRSETLLGGSADANAAAAAPADATAASIDGESTEEQDLRRNRLVALPAGRRLVFDLLNVTTSLLLFRAACVVAVIGLTFVGIAVVVVGILAKD
jgi:hypothetical protein